MTTNGVPDPEKSVTTNRLPDLELGEQGEGQAEANSAPKMHGLHRTREELQIKLDAMNGKYTAASPDTVTSPVSSDGPQDSMPKKHGLRRSKQEVQNKLDTMAGKHTAISSSTVSKTLPRKGLRRTHEERAAKMQAKSGCTIHSARDNNGNDQRNSPGPEPGPHELDSGPGTPYEVQSQESATAPAPYRPAPTRPPLSAWVAPRVVDQALADTGSNDGLVEAVAVIEESTLNILQQAQQVDPNQLSEALERQSIKEMKERQCHSAGYGILVGCLIFMACSLGFGLGLNKT
jgi:hypothetical protein